MLAPGSKSIDGLLFGSRQAAPTTKPSDTARSRPDAQFTSTKSIILDPAFVLHPDVSKLREVAKYSPAPTVPQKAAKPQPTPPPKIIFGTKSAPIFVPPKAPPAAPVQSPPDAAPQKAQPQPARPQQLAPSSKMKILVSPSMIHDAFWPSPSKPWQDAKEPFLAEEILPSPKPARPPAP